MNVYAKIKYIFAATLVCIIACMFVGCDESDDVQEIFTEKQWKLTGIYIDRNPPRVATDYWSSSEDQEASIKWLSTPESLVISFEGFETNGKIQGRYSGKGCRTAISGDWEADGESHKFTIEPDPKQSPDDSDILGKVFIEALRTADKYSGDSKSLAIHFKDPTRPQSRRYLLFRVADKE